MLYLDTSALVKVVRPEPETAELRAWLDNHAGVLLVTSALAEVELPRALLRIGEEKRLPQVRELLDNLLIVEVDAEVRAAAAALADPLLRSLDAIHIASAYQLRPDLTAVVTYDVRMARAVDPTIPVTSPGTVGTVGTVS